MRHAAGDRRPLIRRTISLSEAAPAPFPKSNPPAAEVVLDARTADAPVSRWAISSSSHFVNWAYTICDVKRAVPHLDTSERHAWMKSSLAGRSKAL